MNHKKIAEKAYVSVSTVSKALAGSAEISADTKSRIFRIAMEMGYFKEKSQRKRAYKKNAPPIIAVFLPEMIGSYYPAIAECIKQYVEEKGGQTAFYVYDCEYPKLTKTLDAVILRGSADGAIMVGKEPLDPHVNLPIVCCDCHPAAEHFDSVCCDKSHVMQDAVAHLKALGHEKIGYAGVSLGALSYTSFKEALNHHGLPFNEEYSYITGEKYERAGIEAAAAYLSATDRPTAVVAAYDDIAYGMIYALLRQGVRIPEDLSVMGINNSPTSAYATVPLTTVDIFGPEQYKAAIQILFEKLHAETDVIKHITLVHRLVVRESTAPPRLQ
ncbi:MAG: LacI family DNA-binding transcriptional regulator [Clostridia bacterium]|nr:LacI family DNA-binding transcriptional regulator [Clostridia bacterium]